MSIWVSYLFYEPNNALRAFTTALEFQFKNFNHRGKMVQNVNFSSVSQNCYLSLKFNPTHQYESRCMLGFQNKALDVKILKFHTNHDNNIYLEKCDFQQKLVFQFWDHHWICDVETSLGVVSDSNSSPGWPYMQNEANFNWQFSQFISKNVTFANDTKHRQIIYC